MGKAGSFFREHRLTIGMLSFVVVFYSVAIFGGLTKETPKERVSAAKAPAVSASRADDEVTREAFKQKEESFKTNVLKQPELVSRMTLLALLVLLTGVALDVYFIWNLRRGRPLPGSSLAHGAVAWRGSHVASAVAFMFFSESVLLLVETIVFAVAGKSPHKDFLLMANSLFRDAFTAFFIVWFVTRRLGHTLADVGLTTRDFWRNVGRGLVGYVAILPPLLVSLVLLGVVAGFFRYEPAPQKVVQIYLKKSSDPYLVFFTLFVAGAGPVIEEIFFRGFTYKALRQRFGAAWGMTITSLVFALFHLSLAAFVPIFVLGLFLCWLYERTGSLVPSMTAHMVHNLIMVSLTLGFKSLAG